MTWRPGQSGNPAGRKLGTRVRATMAAERLLDGEAGGLTRKCIELALAGDTTAMRLCMERVAPVRRGRPTVFPLPQIQTPADLPAAMNAVVEAVACGVLTPEEGASLATVLEAHRKTLEMAELERRIAALEAGHG